MRNSPFFCNVWYSMSVLVLLFETRKLWEASAGICTLQTPVTLPYWLLSLETKPQATNDLFLSFYHTNIGAYILRQSSCCKIFSFCSSENGIHFCLHTVLFCQRASLEWHMPSCSLSIQHSVAVLQGIKVFQNIQNFQFLVTSFTSDYRTGKHRLSLFVWVLSGL